MVSPDWTAVLGGFLWTLVAPDAFQQVQRTKTGLMDDCRLFRAISFIFNNVALSVIIRLFLNKPKKFDI